MSDAEDWCQELWIISAQCRYSGCRARHHLLILWLPAAIPGGDAQMPRSITLDGHPDMMPVVSLMSVSPSRQIFHHVQFTTNLGYYRRETYPGSAHGGAMSSF